MGLVAKPSHESYPPLTPGKGECIIDTVYSLIDLYFNIIATTWHADIATGMLIIIVVCLHMQDQSIHSKWMGRQPHKSRLASI